VSVQLLLTSVASIHHDGCIIAERGLIVAAARADEALSLRAHGKMKIRLCASCAFAR
jgi:hypothetical protein